MAWIEERKGGWIGRYRRDGKVKSAGVFPTKRDARASAREAERQVKLGKWIDPKGGLVTVAVWSEKWLAGLDVTPKSRHTYEDIQRSLIAPRWGRTALSQVTLSGVKRWVTEMSGPRGPISDSRRRAAGAQLVRMLDAAVDEGLISSNPARPPSGKVGYLPRPKRQKAHRYLTHSELEALAAAAGDHGTLIRFAGLTGLRWGELVALRVGDVDFLRHQVKVSRAYSIVGARQVLGSTKSHERRTVTFPRSLVEGLAAQAHGKHVDDLLFGSPGGQPLTHSAFGRRVLTPAWQAAGIERLTMHDLRHTAASLAIQAGGNAKTVQNLLGHKSATLTLDTYAGLFDTDAQALAERMDAARNEAVSGAAAHHVPTEPRNVVPLTGRS